jgi:hypothetical protein
MIPNYNNAAAKAYETFTRFGSSDPQLILRRLSNVLLITFDASDLPMEQDAFTCVDQNKYIVFYNRSLSPVQLRSVLARELGHVILRHDGKDPEEIWTEEATCFAYHLLCPPPSACVEIKYRPDLSSVSMSFKSMRVFSSISALKEAVADEHTRNARFIGRHHTYTPDDVQIRNLHEKDIFGHWNNYSAVVLDGKSVGYCGQ